MVPLRLTKQRGKAWGLFLCISPVYAHLPSKTCAALKAKVVNLRSGPSHDHPIIYTYKCQGWPVLIKNQCGHWFLVKDWEGTEGWIHSPLLSFKHMVLIKEEMVPLRNKPCHDSRIMAYLKKGVVARCSREENGWYFIKISEPKASGWLPREAVWP